MPKPMHSRKKIRLPGYDYSSTGAYFVTTGTRGRELLFLDHELKDTAERCWRWLETQYAHVLLDEFVVMPNHFHGVLVIKDAEEGHTESASDQVLVKIKPLGGLIGAFKTVSTQEINRLRGIAGVPVWQRNYYERIVRDDEELTRIRDYILANPLMWADDPENPDRVPAKPT
jgi:REP-associated tyrosine transposase